MQPKICIERIRLEARGLKFVEDAVVNCATLAFVCEMDPRLLSRLFNNWMPELRQELGIVRSKGTDWRQHSLFRMYRQAARSVREDGDLPCPTFIATKLRLRLKRVQRYLREHPDLASQMCLYSDDEALMWRSARIILARGERVTRLRLADEMKRSYATVMRILRERPTWVEDLRIVRAKRGSGVWKRLYPKKRSHMQ